MILLVGASASGKTEIAKLLASTFGLRKAVTTTTRPMRDGERDGVDYYFLSKEEFEARNEQGAFVETTFYNGNYYGCGKSEVKDDRCIVVDPNGLVSFLALNDPRIIAFGLLASEETRTERMRIRGDKEEDIQKRIQNDRISFSDEKLEGVDFKLDTEGKTLQELSERVKDLYFQELEKRG